MNQLSSAQFWEVFKHGIASENQYMNGWGFWVVGESHNKCLLQSRNTLCLLYKHHINCINHQFLYSVHKNDVACTVNHILQEKNILNWVTASKKKKNKSRNVSFKIIKTKGSKSWLLGLKYDSFLWLRLAFTWMEGAWHSCKHFSKRWDQSGITNEGDVHLFFQECYVCSSGRRKVLFFADDMAALCKFHPDISINYNHIAQILVLSTYWRIDHPRCRIR